VNRGITGLRRSLRQRIGELEATGRIAFERRIEAGRAARPHDGLAGRAARLNAEHLKACARGLATSRLKACTRAGVRGLGGRSEGDEGDAGDRRCADHRRDGPGAPARRGRRRRSDLRRDRDHLGVRRGREVARGRERVEDAAEDRRLDGLGESAGAALEGSEVATRRAPSRRARGAAFSMRARLGVQRAPVLADECSVYPG
jgi:hypothetical protein